MPNTSVNTSINATVEPISEARFAEMRDVSWHPHPDCPPPASLAVICMNHWGFDGSIHRGAMVVARALTDEIIAAFTDIFAAHFPIAQIMPIDSFAGDDNASMTANNSSAFNFRVIDGTNRLSNHALGQAIDINPVQNPWLRGGRVLPKAGSSYLDRSDVRPGMIVRPGPVTDAFDKIGWDWGGDWDEYKDYHHFAKYKRGETPRG